MMRKLVVTFHIIGCFLTAVCVSSCSKEPAMETQAKLTANVKSIEVNERVTFYIKGKGEFITFFTGREGQDFDLFPKAQGITNLSSGDSIQVRYTKAGSFKAVLLARSFGNWGDELVQAMDSVRIEVLDREVGITRVRMSKPKSATAVLEEDVIRFNTGAIDLSSVELQVFTKSDAATVYPNSDLTKPVVGGVRFTYDFSGPDPHILVESFSGTTKKYSLVFE